MISVIIPIYNALNDVKICLQSIVENFDFTNGEVILINDCSNHETSQYLNEFVSLHNNFILENNKCNLGYIKTCNNGIKKANGDIVVLLNSDTKIPAGFCKKISDCFNSDKNIGVASPVASHSWLFNISLPLGYSIEKMNTLLDTKHKVEYPLIPAAEGFCFCIRKELLEKQGYLDEVYGKGYHEEVDFSYIAIKNGYKIVLIDNLYVYHRRNASFGVWSRAKLIKQNNKIFKDRWGDLRERYEEEIDFVNPVYKIKKDLFPLKSWLFSIEKQKNVKTFKVLGITFKFSV